MALAAESQTNPADPGYQPFCLSLNLVKQLRKRLNRSGTQRRCAPAQTPTRVGRIALVGLQA
ncbi:MAG: hypothetical protein U0401_24735 [Anaerolineae bacterium]